MQEQKLRNQEWRKSTKQTKLLECSREFWNAGDRAFLRVEKEQDTQESTQLLKSRMETICRKIFDSINTN